MDEDELIRAIAHDTKVIAMVGLSPKPDRPSYGVARYLQSQGYKVIPVNPGHAGEHILDEPVYADLSSIPADARVDMVDIFRRSEAVEPVVDEALSVLPDLRTVWLQLGVVNDAAGEKVRAKGLRFVQDHCPKIEFPRHR